MSMTKECDEKERVHSLLRAVRFPSSQRDIVAAGFVKDIEIQGNRVTVHFAPDTRNQAKVDQMNADIRSTLAEGAPFANVEIEHHLPFADAGVLSSGGVIPPRAADLDPGVPLQTGEPDRMMQRPDMAPEAGYDEDGPEPLGGPRSDIYEGELPVLQWEIDPHDPDAKSGTANLTIGEWDFRVWWQVHPADLVYASIQAMKDDWVEHGGKARSHPVGRAEAVNLVYDIERKAVVAIYGTVQNFRPFVDAFHRSYVLKN